MRGGGCLGARRQSGCGAGAQRQADTQETGDEHGVLGGGGFGATGRRPPAMVYANERCPA
ncbi:hypothetical protein A176_002298 [Myxococcus hansupus]|uniref:Uncharacterized protein n=1 Tax=Pseudomyxococcus hansupus TaxID=1297742 RepID=A0A0H4WPF5_9BACT|nr:hypothetical protein A176_002298 [Myxococcus hansupus]